jgi:ABC-type multidrug transport system ATPase subunit
VCSPSVRALADVLLSHLTVRETVEFAARIRLPASLAIEAKHQRVRSPPIDALFHDRQLCRSDTSVAQAADVLEELGLRPVRNTIVGDKQTRGVSGGERKCASIGAHAAASVIMLVCVCVR